MAHLFKDYFSFSSLKQLIVWHPIVIKPSSLKVMIPLSPPISYTQALTTHLQWPHSLSSLQLKFFLFFFFTLYFYLQPFFGTSKSMVTNNSTGVGQCPCSKTIPRTCCHPCFSFPQPLCFPGWDAYAFLSGLLAFLSGLLASNYLPTPIHITNWSRNDLFNA